tara:strand:+ start:1164 stop:2057 length:894 start_codon:yes stop_codon:yes gene_type:complete
MPSEDNKLSTTALARKLDIPVQQLFGILKDYGWIQRTQESWALTPKGEYEGGSFHTSQRYGSYIVWPEAVERHPLLQAIESNQRITAASMCQYYPHFHARQINRALAELGLQHHSILGWELTKLGRSWGGLQEESASSGAFYVTWPYEIIDNPVIHRELSLQSDQIPVETASEGTVPDLFATSSTPVDHNHGIDGHALQSPLQTGVCNWLYLAQLAHAFHRALPTADLVYADFYLPAGNIYIDCWDTDVPTGELSGKFRKRELYKQLDLRHLEINTSDSDKLDEVLGRGLLAFGIRC